MRQEANLPAIAGNGKGAFKICARELHWNLGVKTRYNDWINRKIVAKGFLLGQDYAVLTNEYGLLNFEYGPERPSVCLSLPAAVELCLGEKTPVARELSRKLIESATQPAQPTYNLPDFNDPIVAARAWADEAERAKGLETRLIEQEAAIRGHKRHTEAKGALNLTNAAKTVGLRPCEFIDLLRSCQWIYKPTANGKWTAYQRRIDQGLLEIKLFHYQG